LFAGIGFSGNGSSGNGNAALSSRKAVAERVTF